MRYTSLCALALLSLCLSGCSTARKDVVSEDRPLKEIFDGKFLMGVAMNRNQILGIDSVGEAQTVRHFNSIVAEDVMKCESIHPEEDRYEWDVPDRFVEFGNSHGMSVIGHCLIWHSQCAPWFCHDREGNLADRETMKKRMRDHIHAVVGRYKGKITGWDVVNEVIMEDGSYRESPFYRILGEEFIPLAFQYAHEADPDAELYVNDYGMDNPRKREAYVRLVGDLKSKGLRVDGIGMQSHMGMDYPDFREYEASITAFASTGCKVMITELDMSALPTVAQGADIAAGGLEGGANPYTDQLPDSVAAVWNGRMTEVFDILMRHSDVISRVTAWGLSDADSWKNNWPVRGRTDYPLLLDRQYNLKPFINKYIQVASK